MLSGDAREVGREGETYDVVFGHTHAEPFGKPDWRQAVTDLLGV